jgi:hypothetical protein
MLCSVSVSVLDTHKSISQVFLSLALLLVSYDKPKLAVKKFFGMYIDSFVVSDRSNWIFNLSSFYNADVIIAILK